MNVIVHNRRNLYFQIPDLDLEIRQFEDRTGVTFYRLDIKLLAQVWTLYHRYSEFDEMNNRLIRDTPAEVANGIPRLPPKRWFYNRDPSFLNERMKGLNKYVKALICIHEAIGNPILQKFLEIDVKYNPYFEYTKITEPDEYSNNNMRKHQVLKSKGFQGDNMEEAEDLMEIEKASPKEWRGEMLEEGEGELLNEEDAMRAYLGLDAKEEANEPDSVILEESKDSHTSEEGDDSRVDASIDNEEQFGMYVGTGTEGLDFGKYEDEYDQLDESQCTNVQRMVKRATHLSNFYTNEIIEYYGLIQQVQLMNGELENAKIEIEMQSKRFRELSQLITQYNSEQPSP